MSYILTTCGFCSCGCGIYVQSENGKVVGLFPSENHPVSRGKLCIKGWNTTSAILGADRLRTPLIRKGERLEPVSWDEAISYTASILKKIISESGPQSIGIIGSAKTTNEECYSLAKFARSVLGTPNIDGACRFYDASLIPALAETTGIPASQVELDAITQAGSILVVGANVMEQLAHVGSRIEDAAEKGCKIEAVDPRETRLAPHTSLWLHPKPGGDLAWVRAMLKIIITERRYTENAPQMPGFEELRASLDGMEMSQLKYSCWLEQAEVHEAVELLASNPQTIVMFGLGVLQQPNSTEIVKGLANIALLLGGSVMALRGQNNAQGACDVGLAYDLLPGYQKLTDPVARKVWELVWNCKLPAEPGMTAVEMLRGCESGALKALMIFGENVVLSAPNTKATLSALDKVDFLAVSDLYLNETANLADVVLPACSFLEKDGTFTNIERRVQRVRKVCEPIGESKSDLEIIGALSGALGAKMSVEPEKVMSEISSSVPIYKEISFKQLDAAWGQQWVPTPSEAKLAPIKEVAEGSEGEYPFYMIASRIIFHQQTGTMAAKSSILTREYPESFAEMNEADAERLGIKPGNTIKITSQTGSLTRVLALSNSVPKGCVHVPHFFEGDSPNALASFETDSASGVPVYKAYAVKVEAVK
ncbi:MAG: molybdopterin-dependent oxidoreductase [Armatimonadota bacterium]|nr:molybdopterin-dependent oxidoreductase [Armatimonadota bacterium]